MSGLPRGAVEDLCRRNSLSDYLPYVAWEDGTYMQADMSLGFVWEIEPLLEAGEDTRRILSGMLGSPALPPGTAVQFNAFASEIVSPLFPAPAAGDGGGGMLGRMTRERRRLYEGGMRERTGVPARDFRFLVSVKLPPPAGAAGDGEAWDARLGEARKVGAGVAGALGSALLRPRDLHPRELVLLLRELLNPDGPRRGDAWRASRPGALWDGREEIRRRVVDRETAVEARAGEIRIGEAVLRGYSPAVLPESFSLGEFHELLGDPARGDSQVPAYFLLHAGFVVPGPGEEARVRAKAVMVKQQSFGLATRFIPRLRRKAENFDFLVGALEDEGLVRGSLGLFVKTRGGEEADGAREAAAGLWRARGFDLREERYVLLPLLLGSLPLGMEPAAEKLLRRARAMQSSAGASLLPVVSDWRGTGSGPLSFVSRRGQVMKVDLFDSPSNYNCAVFAQSGSGKSFLVSDMIAGYLAEGARVFVIDVGRSYEKLCRLMGGEFLAFDDRGGISLNPFSGVGDIDGDMELLKPLFARMAAPSGKMGDLGGSLLEEAIRTAWEKEGRGARIDDVAEALRRSGDRRRMGEDLARMLGAYSSRGRYGRFFEGGSGASFDGDFTVLELEELRAMPDLQAAVLLTVIWRIEREMYLGDRSRRKLAVIDEAWDLLGGGFSGEFIAHGYRRARKYNGAFVSVTQSLLDFYRAGAVGEAVLENSAWTFMLRQKGESVEEMKKGGKLLLGPYFSSLVSSLSTRPGEFSELFMHNGERGMGVGRLVVDPFSYWTYTTSPDEVSLLDGFVARGMDTAEAIERCAEVSGRR